MDTKERTFEMAFSFESLFADLTLEWSLSLEEEDSIGQKQES